MTPGSSSSSMPSVPSTRPTGPICAAFSPPGMLAIDNAISHTHELAAFNRLLDQDPQITSALVPVGAGLILAVDGRPAGADR